MDSLLQLFEFSYPDGFLFYDHSGALSRRLQEIFPGLSLSLKDSSVAQRNFVLPAEDLDLFFGVSLAHIQTLAPQPQDFAQKAALFLQALSETLDINQLADFRFRQVIGRICSTVEEAQELLWPLVAAETKATMQSLDPSARWFAVQGEFVQGNFVHETRFAVMNLVPHPPSAPAGVVPGTVLPHFTCHFDVRGIAPIAVSEFDANAFIENVRRSQSQEILAKLAPHLAKLHGPADA